MNGNQFLLDTNAVLYILNQEIKVSSSYIFYISFITELELFSYKFISLEDEAVIHAFLEKINIIDIETDIKSETIKLRKKYSLRLPDAIIVATSKVYDLMLITNDKQLHKITDLLVTGCDSLLNQ